ncbi:hypothetical protein DUNSADRAFT_14516 [Dunaliella salina]|uniref:DEAD-box RNA helicase Q domain-containing protein n=1 Tax=Dunaliella salina TaxID=3046 RepID=A0ABQ7G7A1_DUNSA|nr:hypothetical protein DUNSADRAFT_14516 [Dunaliella salina]|eukprot:KAF5830490.1 hypothetical protein DUNSADRAFT_14516 [Dunaliella salina]
MDLHAAGRHACTFTHVQKQHPFLRSSSLAAWCCRSPCKESTQICSHHHAHTTQRASLPLHARVGGALTHSQTSSPLLLLPSSHLPRRASMPRSCQVACTSSSWNAWGSDSEDAEEDLLAQLAAKSQRASAAAAAARTSSASSPALHQQLGSISSLNASTPASPGGTPQLSRPAASPYVNLLLPGSPSSSPLAPSMPSLPGLQPPLKPQLDAARQRGRRGMPKPSSMFPKADPLIDAAYKGTQCTAYYMATGEKYPRFLKDFNSLRHRPFSFPKRLQENMLAARMRVPTPIQKRAMPAIARGKLL